MINPKTKTKHAIASLFVLGFFLSWCVFASETNGTIDETNKYAWSENSGWIDFGADEGNVHVSDSGFTGYAWGENIGWISLNCSNDDSCETSDFKVENDGEGNLTGYAWGENIGWIDFAPTGGGVTIDDSGDFSGYAWSENIGWIVFNCQTNDSCGTSDFKVGTDWRPLSARDAEQAGDSEEAEDLDVSDVEYKVTDTTITIKWETNNKADSKVRWGENRNLENEKKDGQNEKKHKIKLKDLEPNTGYYFRVSSEDENGSSDRSKIYSATTDKAENFLQSLVPSGWQAAEKALEYEELKIDISDQEDEKEDRQEEETRQAGPADEIGQPTEKTAPENAEKPKEPGFFSKIGKGIASLTERISGGIKSGILNAQKGIKKLAQSVGDKFEKQQTEKRYFTTRVFKKDEKKHIAQVKFQILDRSENPIPSLETTLSSEPQKAITDDDGIATFKDVEIGIHSLAFAHGGEDFRKKVEVGETLTDEGIVRAEVVPVKAMREKIALWMWGVILAALVFLATAIWFGAKYYGLKKQKSIGGF